MSDIANDVFLKSQITQLLFYELSITINHAFIDTSFDFNH